MCRRNRALAAIGRRFISALFAAVVLFAAPAHAGRSCDAPQPPKVITIERSLNLALRTWQALEQSGAQVVILARAGQDLSKYGRLRRVDRDRGLWRCGRGGETDG